MLKIIKFMVGFMFVNALSAQDQPSVSASEKGKFAMGIFGEYGKYEHAFPMALQGDYLKKNWMGTVIFSINPYRYNRQDSFSFVDSKDIYARISFLGGVRLGKKRSWEVTGGYTLRICHFDNQLNYTGVYSSSMKGMSFAHFMSLHMGYRFNIGQHFFIKPELSLDYRFKTTHFFSHYEEEYVYGSPSNKPINVLGNFFPLLRLGIGYTFGK